MKLANRAYIITLLLLTLVFAVSAQTAQTTDSDARSAKDDRNTAPTVGTGGPMGGPTGLFTVYDGQTLRRGEFTFSAAWSNFDRDPGNADITEIPVSFQVGLTNNIELFFNTDAYRGVKINSPRNLSSFYLPNSRINGVSPAAIILAPSGPGNGPFENTAIFRPAGSQPFVQFPYVGGSSGLFGLPPGFAGPLFGFPVNATMGPPADSGGAADNFPGIGSVFGSILPGVVLQTVTINGSPVPTVFSTEPSYLNDAPFMNRTWGTSSFSTFTAGVKWRFNNIRDSVGWGVIGAYRWYADNADDFAGFNQLQRGASPGGNRGDFLATFFIDGRLATWANLSANVGYHWNSSVKGDFPGGTFTLLDRPDELLFSFGADFPVNKYFQPIFEFRSLSYVGGRTPNAFENDPMDGIAGFRIFPARWFGFGFAYRYHFNEQDENSFDDDQETFRGSATVLCSQVTPGGGQCVPDRFPNSFDGAPPGFQASSDPHGFIVQAFIGRRDKRQEELINQNANVTAVTLSDSEISLPCAPGFRSQSGGCTDSTTINVSTTAVDPENDVLTYNYTVSGGRISGTGANVQWDLSGATPGTYTITAGVDDGCGICGRTETKTITVADCPDCVRVCECPTLSVSGPAGITSPGGTMTFTANVSGGSQESVTYDWSVSAGEISSGQGTPSITVNVPTEMAGGNITATVKLGGIDPNCRCDTEASETAPVAPKAEAQLVDEFGPLSNDDVRARVDNFFIQLQNNPNAQGYIINYASDRQIAARERLITNHINMRGYDRSRITFVRGGEGTGQNTKMFLVPPGADVPQP